jgi:hypothetical protein
MLVGAIAALTMALAATAWAQTPSETDASQAPTSDPAMTTTYQETSSMPATASPMALLAVAGMIALGAGAAMSKKRG